ncbi:hypothetical protein C8R47DRAFT_1086148 [Mycena vitilis]|nr:hypothetical protein C8R47DRAFT_1086148 [Mycena vitilis]
MAAKSTLARQATLPADTDAVNAQAEQGESCTTAVGSTPTSQVAFPSYTGAVDPQTEQGGVPLRERTESLDSVECLRNEEWERAMDERARLRWEESLKRRVEASAQRRRFLRAVLLKVQDGAMTEDATTEDQQDGYVCSSGPVVLPADSDTELGT